MNINCVHRRLQFYSASNERYLNTTHRPSTNATATYPDTNLWYELPQHPSPRGTVVVQFWFVDRERNHHEARKAGGRGECGRDEVRTRAWIPLARLSESSSTNKAPHFFLNSSSFILHILLLLAIHQLKMNTLIKSNPTLKQLGARICHDFISRCSNRPAGAITVLLGRHLTKNDVPIAPGPKINSRWLSYEAIQRNGLDDDDNNEEILREVEEANMR